MALAIVVGNVIGSGIFLKPGSIAAEAGDFRLILSAWLVGGAVCGLGALCFAELAAMLPRAGGLYAFLKEAYGKPAAFLFSWNEFLFNRPASIGALSVAFAGALGLSLGRTLTQPETIFLALGLILLLTWVNIRGVLWGGWVQGATTLVKASFLGLLALLPFLMAPFSETGIDWANYSSRVEPSGDMAPGTRFGLVLLSVMWAYNGWHGITPVAEEVRDPERNIPRAMFGGVGLLTVLYVSANLAYHGVLSMGEMAAAGPHAAETMVAALLGPFGAAAMAAVIMCSTFGGINSNLLLSTRIPFALGRDRLLAPVLGRVHAAYRTPFVAIIVQAFMAALLVDRLWSAHRISGLVGREDHLPDPHRLHHLRQQHLLRPGRGRALHPAPQAARLEPALSDLGISRGAGALSRLLLLVPDPGVSGKALRGQRGSRPHQHRNPGLLDLAPEALKREWHAGSKDGSYPPPSKRHPASLPFVTNELVDPGDQLDFDQVGAGIRESQGSEQLPVPQSIIIGLPYPSRARTTASGSRSITVNRTRAARSGTRRPCSQS